MDREFKRQCKINFRILEITARNPVVLSTYKKVWVTELHAQLDLHFSYRLTGLEIRAGADTPLER